MTRSGRVAFGAMEAVVFSKPAAEAVAEEARLLGAERVFLMVSGTLNRTTDEIAKVRRALGNRFAGVFDRMPPHTPRNAVIEAAAAARETGADLIATIGGGPVTDARRRCSCAWRTRSVLRRHSTSCAQSRGRTALSDRRPATRLRFGRLRCRRHCRQASSAPLPG